MLAHRSLFAGLVEQVSQRAGALVVGSKQDPATDIGPLVSSAEAARVVSWVEEAVAAGATVHVGGTRTGSFVNPAVLTGVPHSARLWSEEVFGPVVAIEPYDDLDTAVAVVNGVDTGLQAGVFTRDIDLALDVADRLRVGAVLVNSTSDYRIDAMPFGGFKRSGICREGVQSAILAMTEPKVVAIRSRLAS